LRTDNSELTTALPRLDWNAATEAERRSALPGAVPEPGKIVFVYRKIPPAPAAPASDHAAFPRHAA
jgi:hypothetical protein